MGQNSLCYLPSDVRADDLILAISYLCGAERIRGGEGSGTFWASVDYSEVEHRQANKKADHVWIESTNHIQYYRIQIAPTTIDGEYHEGSLFLEPSHTRPGRILIDAGVNDFWKKIDRALVDMFGGEIDDNDCDSVDVDYRKRKPRKINCPGDGQEWEEFQEALLNLPVLGTFLEEE